MRLLETLAEHLSDRYVWRGPVGFEMATCGEPGAFWDLSMRKIIVCYELAVDYANLYRGYDAAWIRLHRSHPHVEGWRDVTPRLYEIVRVRT